MQIWSLTTFVDNANSVPPLALWEFRCKAVPISFGLQFQAIVVIILDCAFIIMRCLFSCYCVFCINWGNVGEGGGWVYCVFLHCSITHTQANINLTVCCDQTLNKSPSVFLPIVIYIITHKQIPTLCYLPKYTFNYCMYQHNVSKSS